MTSPAKDEQKQEIAASLAAVVSMETHTVIMLTYVDIDVQRSNSFARRVPSRIPGFAPEHYKFGNDNGHATLPEAEVGTLTSLFSKGADLGDMELVVTKGAHIRGGGFLKNP